MSALEGPADGGMSNSDGRRSPEPPSSGADDDASGGRDRRRRRRSRSCAVAALGVDVGQSVPRALAMVDKVRSLSGSSGSGEPGGEVGRGYGSVERVGLIELRGSEEVGRTSGSKDGAAGEGSVTLRFFCSPSSSNDPELPARSLFPESLRPMADRRRREEKRDAGVDEGLGVEEDEADAEGCCAGGARVDCDREDREGRVGCDWDDPIVAGVVSATWVGNVDASDWRDRNGTMGGKRGRMMFEE